jgi:hypothetical protein
MINRVILHIEIQSFIIIYCVLFSPGPPSLPKDAPKYKDVKPEAGELSWQPGKTQKGFLESAITYQVEMK